MASAQEVGRRIATVISPVANLVTAQGAGGALRQLLEIAIDGYGRLPSAKSAAARHLLRQAGSADEAISSIIDHHVRLASAQGFVTNIGGLATLPVAIPANITGVATVQVRMVAAIAHLRGYDLNDNRVRTALVMCLMGGEQVAKHIAEGTLPTSPLAVATARQARGGGGAHRPRGSHRRKERRAGDREASSPNGRRRQRRDGWHRHLPDRSLRVW
jgi:hypothetical protein